MNERQKRFCQYYIQLGNISQAALKAGYSKNNGAKLIKKPEIKQYIDSQLQKLDDQRIAKAKEVMKYLTSVMRGEQHEEVIVLENCGPGCSNARSVKKKVSSKERLKAAELLGKRYSIFNQNNQSVNNQSVPLVIIGEKDLPS